MAPSAFEEMIEAERIRLHAALKDVEQRQQALDEEIMAIRRELYAVEAYDAARTGQTIRGATAISRRASVGSKQEAILSLIRGSGPGGMTRGEILYNLGLKGNKSGEQSVSNTLSNMKSAGKVIGNGGRYQIP